MASFNFVKSHALSIRQFNLPNEEPDTRITIFNLEFHLHSSVLKANSRFFERFLDSPDKVLPESEYFTYEWVSEVDEEDGSSWHLVQKKAKRTDFPLKAQSVQIKAITMMFKAMYRIPFEITFQGPHGEDRFEPLLELADYYRCIPAVSRNLSECLLMSERFLRGFTLFSNTPIVNITAAYKLRHPSFFRECALQLAGSMLSEDDKKRVEGEMSELPHPIKKAVEYLRCQITTKILEAQIETLTVSETSEEHRNLVSKASERREPGIPEFPPGGSFPLPRYYRNFIYLAGLQNIAHDYPRVRELLENKSELNTRLVAGEEPGKSHFYCGYLPDEKLPWDRSQTDW